MPLNIVVLCADDRTEQTPGNTAVQNYVYFLNSVQTIRADSYIEHDDGMGRPRTIHPVEIIVNRFFHQAANKTVVFQEIFRDGLEENFYLTGRAAVVIYNINVLPNETPEAFAERAKREITFLQDYDVSDDHATKHLVINQCANTDPNFRKPNQANFELRQFISAQGFTSEFTINNEEDFEKGYVKNYFDVLIEYTSLPNIFSRFIGSIFNVLLGGLSLFILMNPLNLFFTSWSLSRWDTLSNFGRSSFLLIFSSCVYLGLFSQCVIEGARVGWNRGWLVGLESPFYIARDMYFSKRSDLSLRNFIASLVIIGLATVTVLLTLGMLGPAVVGGIGLTALAVKGAAIPAAFVGLSSSKVALAVFAGTAAVVAGSIIYGIGYGVFLGLKAFVNLFRSSQEVPDRNSTTTFSHQGPLEYSPTLELAVQPAPVAEKTPLAAAAPQPPIPPQPSIPVVNQGGEKPYQDAFGPAAYRPLFPTAPAAAAPKGSSSRPASPAPEPEASPKPPPDARSVPYTELPPQSEYPLSLRGAPLDFSSYPDPLPAGAWPQFPNR
jgi:hypothetical protein